MKVRRILVPLLICCMISPMLTEKEVHASELEEIITVTEDESEEIGNEDVPDSSDGDELLLDEDELPLGEDELLLDEDELPLGEDELFLDEDELPLGEGELPLGEDELPLGEGELLLDEDEPLLGEKELFSEQNDDESQTSVQTMVSEGNETYYVDADNGDDANDGTTPDTAWKSLEKVNSVTFLPGDTLLFQKGDSWHGQLSPKGSGTQENPIKISSYGTSDAKPAIHGDSWCASDGDDLDNRIFNAAVFFYNQEYWEVSDLEITNYDPDDSNSHIKKYGILIMGKDAGTLHHMYCQNLYVHDVSCIPIGDEAGIGRGGIIYIIRGNETATRWDDILIEGNYLEDINHYAINLLSTWGSTSFSNESGIPSSESVSTRSNSTNIVIRNNYCKNIGNAAICPSAYEDALIEYNVCDSCNSGPNGNVPIWWENGERTIVQYNEVFKTGGSATKEDSQAFDADRGAALSYIQYNYTHDNPSGAYYECSMGTSYTTYIRYNISINDGYGVNNLGNGAVFTLQQDVSGSKIYVYNNFIYMDGEEGEDGYVHDGMITRNWLSSSAEASNYQFWNNVIYSEGEKGWDNAYKGTVKNNAYGGSNAAILRNDDSSAIVVTEDDFVGLGEVPCASYDFENEKIIFSDLSSYRIVSDSVCIDAGIRVLNNGGQDYYGNTVQELVKPNIGVDNSYNTGVTADTAEDKIILDFEDCEEDELTGVYQHCDWGNRGWNTSYLNGSMRLWATKFTSDAQVNKIAVPDGYTVTSFEAYCANGTAEVTVDTGVESKSFSVNSYNKTYFTYFQKEGSAAYIIIKAQNGIDSVKFDNIVLSRITEITNSLSRGKTATASSYERDPANAVDGDRSSLWVADGNTETTGAWWKVDLGEKFKISHFVIAFEKEEENAWKYKVEGSADGTEWDLLWDNSENTDGSAEQTGYVSDEYKEHEYRYIKVTITGLPSGSMWPAIAEFDVFQQQTMTNVVLDRPASASSQESSSRSADKANDGDETSLWIADGNTEKIGAWWKVELDKPCTLSALEILFEKDEKNPWKYKVEGSSDDISWDLLWDQTGNTDCGRKHYYDLTGVYTERQYRYLKVTITGLPTATIWPAIAEFCAYTEDGNSDSQNEIVLTEKGQNIDLDLAFGQPVTASSESVSGSAEHVTDRDSSTTWSPASTAETAYLQIDLDREYNLQNCRVSFEGGSQAYKVEVKGSNGWITAANVTAENADGTAACIAEQVTAVKFSFENPSSELKISQIAFDGTDAGISHGKRILVMAPHEDDEMLMAGGVMKRAIDVGDEVYVVVATNGDYEGGTSKGETRIEDTVDALETIGVSKDNIYFLGYADTGGMGVGQWATAFTDSFLYKLYIADDNTVLTSNNGISRTYGCSGVKMDYHYERTGSHASYTRSNFVDDLQTLVENCNPTDIYVTSRYDMHFDHAYFNLFATEVIQNIQKENNNFRPTMHEAIIHTHLTDEVYPLDSSMFGKGHEGETLLTAWIYPDGLDDKTTLNWSDRENVLVPYAMRQTPYKYNLKDQALRKYTTEYYSWIASFTKVNEVFWAKDFESIAHLAEVTASSEKTNSDKSIDQSSDKAVDGIADGYAAGLPNNHSRFPHAEWKTDGEGAGAWLNLSFDTSKTIDRIVLYDCPDLDSQITKARLEFDNGQVVQVNELPNDGRAYEINLDNISSKNVKLVIEEVSISTTDAGLTEIEVYGN